MPAGADLIMSNIAAFLLEQPYSLVFVYAIHRRWRAASYCCINLAMQPTISFGAGGVSIDQPTTSTRYLAELRSKHEIRAIAGTATVSGDIHPAPVLGRGSRLENYHREDLRV